LSEDVCVFELWCCFDWFISIPNMKYRFLDTVQTGYCSVTN